MTLEGLFFLAQGCENLQRAWVNTATMNCTLTNREAQYQATDTYKLFHYLYPHVDFCPYYGVQYGEIPPRDEEGEDDVGGGDDDDDDELVAEIVDVDEEEVGDEEEEDDNDGDDENHLVNEETTHP